jgi:hypothetical protein
MRLLHGSLALGLVFAASSLVQADGVRDAGNKLRGDYEHVFSQQNTNYTNYSNAPVYRAPATTAQGEARRSFSAEGGQQAPAAQPVQSAPCGAAVTPAPAPAATAQAPAQGARRYSYEPSVNNMNNGNNYYSGRRAMSTTPQYLLPKSDPNKFRVW